MNIRIQVQQLTGLPSVTCHLFFKLDSSPNMETVSVRGSILSTQLALDGMQ